jgi:hypothetical protein
MARFDRVNPAGLDRLNRGQETGQRWGSGSWPCWAPTRPHAMGAARLRWAAHERSKGRPGWAGGEVAGQGHFHG